MHTGFPKKLFPHLNLKNRAADTKPVTGLQPDRMICLSDIGMRLCQIGTSGLSAIKAAHLDDGTEILIMLLIGKMTEVDLKTSKMQTENNDLLSAV